MNSHHCPLCSSAQSKLYHTDSTREYYQCLRCDFFFVPSAFHLTDCEEKARYDLHQNDQNDLNYRQFLSQVSEPLLDRLAKQSTGLDFGCGPGPTLSIMLEEAGHQVDLYDKFYAQNDEVFSRKYNFIAATEVVEHLRDPAFELQRLIKMLKPKGVLVLMTEMLNDSSMFAEWYYKNDPSHVGFFNRNSFIEAAKAWQVKLTIVSERVVIFEC